MAKVIEADFSKLPKESLLIREIIDTHMFHEIPLDELPEEMLLQALHLMLVYVPYLEVTLKANKIKKLETEEEE